MDILFFFAKEAEKSRPKGVFLPKALTPNKLYLSLPVFFAIKNGELWEKMGKRAVLEPVLFFFGEKLKKHVYHGRHFFQFT